MKTYTLTASGDLYMSNVGFLTKNSIDLIAELAKKTGLDGSFNGKVSIVLTVNDDDELTITEEES